MPTELNKGQCVTCARWDNKEGSGRYGTCEHTKCNDDDYPTDGMMVEFSAHAIVTGPEFGCVHWEKKSDLTQKKQAKAD